MKEKVSWEKGGSGGQEASQMTSFLNWALKVNGYWLDE